METNLNEIKKSTYRYWYKDGLAELVTGCIFVIIGLFSLAQGLTEPHTAGRLIASITNMLAIASGPWVARPILRKLKENVTYPRSGYVSYQKPSKSSRNLSWVLAGLVAMVITWVLIRTQQVTMAWIPLIEGLAVGGFIFYQAHLNGLLRYYLLAAFAFILGAGISIAQLGDIIGMGIFFGVMGLALLVSGGATLVLYLQNENHSESETE